MIGASAVVEQPVETETPYLYEARVTAYIKPDNLAAVEKADNSMSALKGALDALEQQVRELRGMRREPWKRP